MLQPATTATQNCEPLRAIINMPDERDRLAITASQTNGNGHGSVPAVPELVTVYPSYTYADNGSEEPTVPLSHYGWILRRHKWRILAFVVVCVASTGGSSGATSGESWPLSWSASPPPRSSPRASFPSTSPPPPSISTARPPPPSSARTPRAWPPTTPISFR